MTLVLDASMTTAWLFNDERTAAAHGVMRRAVAEGAIVPSLWRLEEDLSLYDAAYLEPALRWGMSLASCDKALLAAAVRRKVEVFGA